MHCFSRANFKVKTRQRHFVYFNFWTSVTVWPVQVTCAARATRCCPIHSPRSLRPAIWWSLAGASFTRHMAAIMARAAPPSIAAARVTRRCLQSITLHGPPHLPHPDSESLAWLSQWLTQWLTAVWLTQWLTTAAAPKQKSASLFGSGILWWPYLEHPYHHVMYIRKLNHTWIHILSIFLWVHVLIHNNNLILYVNSCFFISSIINSYMNSYMWIWIHICEYEFIHEFMCMNSYIWNHIYEFMRKPFFVPPKSFVFFMNLYVNSWFFINSCMNWGYGFICKPILVTLIPGFSWIHARYHGFRPYS